MAEKASQQRPGCLALIVTPAEQILLQHRDDKPGICWPGHWSVPGGHQEPGETPQETILREIKEETGIVPDTLREAHVRPHEQGKRPPHVFYCTWTGTESDLVLGEGQALRLFPLTNMPAPMPPQIRQYIRQLILDIV